MTARVKHSMCLAAGLLLCATQAIAQVRFDITHAFNAPGPLRPYAPLVQGLDGNFYGTTFDGGAANQGIIFRMTPGGVITIVHSFDDGTGEGSHPYAGLIVANDGNFYGTTRNGGTGGGGTVYKMTPAGVVTTLYSFTYSTDGGFPYSGVIQASDGHLYGTTQQSAASGYGTVFRVTLAGTFTKLYEFAGGADGGGPYGGLVQAGDGNLWGMTQVGGTGSNGVIFKITTGGTYTPVYSFIGYPEAANPSAGLTVGLDGALYGMSSYGGSNSNGAIFKITTAGAYTKLYDFDGSIGGYPTSTLIRGTDNNFYGTVQFGGDFGYGSVFRMTPLGVTTIVHSFTNADGAYPYAGVYQGVDGLLYGTTTNDDTNAAGTAFKVSIDGTFTLLAAFTGGADGASSNAGVIVGSDGNLYGTSYYGGTSNQGTVFKMTPAGAVTILHSFVNKGDSLAPTTALVEGGDGYFYGSALSKVFKVTSGGTFLVVHSMTGAEGLGPSAFIRGMDGNFYFTMQFFGAAFKGTVVKMTPAGTVTVLHTFFGGATDGASPVAALVQAADGNFYGTTTQGGAFDNGTVFRVTPGGVFTLLHSFQTNVDGNSPKAPLLQAADGDLYGLTNQGGPPTSYGTAFKITTGGTFTLLHAFKYTDGAFPAGGLVQTAGGAFFGTTTFGGAHGVGTVFRMSSAGAVILEHSFNFTDGSGVFGTLAQASPGNFYGTTYYGANGFGEVFHLQAEAIGDFNLDLKGDLLLRNKSTGQNIGWLMNGTTVGSSAFLSTIADTNWEIKGTGDLDANGKADVIWRNKATGQNIGWLMDGLTITAAAFLPTIADTNWEIKGVGDFNGDGKADVIWRNKATGQNIAWLMNGLTVSLAAFLPTIADTNWEIKGVGDFDGEGKADVIWRNKSTGQDIVWLMNGAAVGTAAFTTTVVDTNWDIVGVGDVSGDGKADVLFRHKVTGGNMGWLMNGTVVATSGSLPTIADLNWEIKGVRDFDADGKADVVWRNKSTGQNIVWLMNGLTVATSAFLPTIADTNWEIVGQ